MSLHHGSNERLSGLCRRARPLGKKAESGAEAQDTLLVRPTGNASLIAEAMSLSKADPGRGSQGTQPVPAYRTPNMDEFIYILEGSGTLILDDERYPIERGGTIYPESDSFGDSLKFVGRVATLTLRQRETDDGGARA